MLLPFLYVDVRRRFALIFRHRKNGGWSRQTASHRDAMRGGGTRRCEPHGACSDG
jgi:hypothetical protein|tara:strand:+ start:339 stop:503 length:165 start_codon:yes stop_codon:yes gene_type:complete